MNNEVNTSVVYDDILQFVSFTIGNEEYAVNILQVQEILKMMEITAIPQTPAFIEGIVNLRGKVVPVINLRTKLNLDKIEYDHNTRIIVVNINDKTIGFIVDNVREVLRIPKSITELPPQLVNGINTEYFSSIAKLENRLIIILNIDNLLSKDEIDKLDIV